MQVDPTDPGQGPGNAQGGDGGSPPEGSQPGTDPDRERLERENAQLRQQRREDRAALLGMQHNLSPAQVLELAKVNLDQQEARVQEWLAQRPQGQASAPPASAPEPTPQQPAPTGEPPNPEALQRMEATGEPSAEVRLSWVEEMNARVAQAETLEEIAEIQREYRNRLKSSQPRA